jgi:hypothetical protein
MFCQHCGSALDEGARFCKSCGNAVPGPANTPQFIVPDPVQVLSNHVRVLGILWLVYSIFHIVMAAWTLAFSHYFLPAMQDAFSHSNIPFPFPIFRFMHVFYALTAIYGVATGILGIFAGAALLQRKRTARVLAIVAAFICVISIPFGTAIGVYTLVILLPGHAARAYEQIATPN